MTFDEVYRQHFEFVVRSLRRLGVRENEAADATQEVFMVVYRKLDSFRGQSKLTTWLYGVCFRVASHLRRPRAPGAGDHFDLEAVDRLRAAGKPDEEQEAHESRALLESIMDVLPMEQRAVFGLFELDGWTGEQIAALLEIPLGTVYSRLRLARKAFQAEVSRLSVPRAAPRQERRFG